MRKHFLGKRLFVFTAHPDDESFGIGGTLYKNYQQGGEAIVACATRGEKGAAHLQKPLSASALKRLREKELRASARFLHVSKLFILGLPDGGLTERAATLFEKALTIVREEKPEALLSFGSYGMSGHLDHITVGEVAKRIARALHVPFYTFTLPPRLVKSFLERIKLRRRSPHYTRRPPVFEQPSVKISVNPKIKLKAASFHKSQLGGEPLFAGMAPAVRRARLRAEYFHEHKIV